jgi:hypothetical protein
MTIRYWVDATTNFCCADGELTENCDFVFEDRMIRKNNHFASKHEAFKDYCDEMDEEIEKVKNKVEVLRAKL